MKRLSKAEIQRLKAQGATVESMEIPAKPLPPVPPQEIKITPKVEVRAQMGDLSRQIQSLVQTISQNRRRPWRLEFIRDRNMLLKSVTIHPIEDDG